MVVQYHLRGTHARGCIPVRYDDLFKFRTPYFSFREMPNMSAKILIAYATRAGSTAEIAQAMGKAMTARGAIVDVKPIAKVADIAAYQLIVLGSVVHAGRLMPEVMRFARAHKAELAARPVAAFTVCLAAKSKTNRKRIILYYQHAFSTAWPIYAAQARAFLWKDGRSSA
jgi:hypothetical protein